MGIAKKEAPPPARVELKKEDTVKVISGRDRGKTGRVLRVDHEKGRILVEHVSMVKRHTRPQPGLDTQRAPQQQLGGVIEREGPIHVSNVMPIDPKDGKPTRLRVERSGGSRVRVAKRSGTPLD